MSNSEGQCAGNLCKWNVQFVATDGTHPENHLPIIMSEFLFLLLFCDELKCKRRLQLWLTRIFAVIHRKMSYCSSCNYKICGTAANSVDINGGGGGANGCVN